MDAADPASSEDDTNQGVEAHDQISAGVEAGAEDARDEPADLDVTSIDYTVGLLSFTYSGNRHSQVGCSENTFGPTRPNSTWPWPIQAQNGCAVRVWLYQNSNRTGYRLCLNRHTNTGNFHRTYREFFISNNSSPCP
jgi:hypothetical protein